MNTPRWKLYLIAALGFGALSNCASPDADRETRILRAENSTQRADWVAAGELWFRLYEQDPEPRFARETARALAEQGDAASAASVLSSASRRFPNDVELLLALAAIQADHADSMIALQTYEQALELEPQNVAALRGVGRLRLLRDEPEEAAASFGRAAAIERDGATDRNGETERLAALALEGTGDFAAAFERWRAALLFGGEPDQFRRAARLARDPVVLARDPDARLLAIEWLERASVLAPQDAELEFELGRLYHESNDPPRAVLHLRRSVELDPTDVPALTLLAEAYATSGDTERARAFIDRALDLSSVGEGREALLARREALEAEQAAEPEPDPEPTDGEPVSDSDVEEG